MRHLIETLRETPKISRVTLTKELGAPSVKAVLCKTYRLITAGVLPTEAQMKDASNFWTPDKVEHLIQLLRDTPEMSRSKMATLLGAKSRNAVIGKIMRLAAAGTLPPDLKIYDRVESERLRVAIKNSQERKRKLKDPNHNYSPKVSRALKVVGPDSFVPKAGQTGEQVVRAMRAAIAEMDSDPVAPHNWKRFAETGPNDCMWPKGSYVCGRRKTGRVYCAEHTARAQGTRRMRRTA